MDIKNVSQPISLFNRLGSYKSAGPFLPFIDRINRIKQDLADPNAGNSLGSSRWCHLNDATLSHAQNPSREAKTFHFPSRNPVLEMLTQALLK